MHLPEHDDEVVPAGDLDARTQALQATVASLTGRRCASCDGMLCGHGAVLAVVLGYKHAPRCARCIAVELHEPAASLAERALQWIVRRECFAHVWRHASADEGHAVADRPACLFADSPSPAPIADRPPDGSRRTYSAAALAAAEYDAGDLGCGDLVLELRTQLSALAGGAVLHVTARDPAAPVDLPAWCGLTGHTLLSSDHPHYLIQRKRE